MTRSILLAASALAAALSASTLAQAAEPPLNESARDIREIREVALSPDAALAAVTISASTAEGGQTHIWLLSTDGKTARQVTSSTSDKQPGERTPEWTRDGTSLFFIASRADASRLYRLPTAGGEADALVIGRTPAGELKAGWNLSLEGAVDVGLSGYQVSPDDRTIAVIASDRDTAAREAQVKKKDDATRVGRDDVHKARLYLVAAATGAAREVALPDDVQFVRWSDDGAELLVVTALPSDDLGPASRLWRVKAADGSSKEVAGVPNTVTRAFLTAAGFVYLAQCEADTPPGCLDVYAYDAAAKTTRNLTRDLKGSLADPIVVEPGGRAIVTPIQAGVRQRLARFDLATGAMTWLDGPEPVIATIDANAAGTGWALLATGPTQPQAAYFTPRLGAPAVKLAAPQLLPPDWPPTPSQTVTWTNRGLTLEGLLYLPKVAPGTKVPLVALIHGGPAAVWQDRYSYLANLLVAQGWAVFEPNPRGSTGYGTAFMAANKNDLGGGDYTDVVTGVDAVLAKYPLDPARTALIGYSYGGEMAGFVAGRTDRFKALVAGAPVIDQFSEYGTEDSSWYDRWYFGKPWERFADAWRQSPLAKVGKARTPLLLLQGEDDPTDPLGQSQEMYRAMRQVGAPVVLVTYPRENHRTLGRAFSASPAREPWHGVDLRRRMIEFLADAFAGKPPAER